MAYEATVYRILIASPSDVIAERKAIPEVVSAWNATHSEDYGVVLMPVMWETHSTPELGDRPQAIINKQLVGACDMLVGAFWTRIGTHTGVAESGTVEEIQEMEKAGKPVLLYFSSVPVALDSVDREQYKLLTDFKEKCQAAGLPDKYDSVSGLREKLLRHLTRVVRQLHGEPSFVTIGIDEDLRSVDSVKQQLQALVTRAEVDWTTERDSKPVSIDDAKYILKRLTSDLIDFGANLEGVADQPVLQGIETQISNLKRLKDHQLYVDGGKSYGEFWETGDGVFASLRDIIGQVAYKEPPPEQTTQVGGLEEEKVKILKLLAAAEESGRERMEDSEISHSTGFSVLVTRYHLRSLQEQDYIHTSHGRGRPPLYGIHQKGRSFLISNRLI